MERSQCSRCIFTQPREDICLQVHLRSAEPFMPSVTPRLFFYALLFLDAQLRTIERPSGITCASYALHVASVFARMNPPLLLRFHVVRCCVLPCAFASHRHVGHAFVRVRHGLVTGSPGGRLSGESMFAAVFVCCGGAFGCLGLCPNPLLHSSLDGACERRPTCFVFLDFILHSRLTVPLVVTEV